jgi:hypothetical protein
LNLPFVYAKETVRLYLEDMAVEADTIIEQLRGCTDSLIRKAPLHGLWIGALKYLPVDIDTSVLDNSKSKKEGLSRTYQGYDGYHPNIRVSGERGVYAGLRVAFRESALPEGDGGVYQRAIEAAGGNEGREAVCIPTGQQERRRGYIEGGRGRGIIA